MSMLALNIRMQGKLTVIIGGGGVALRKLRSLLATGASVKVVTLNVCPDIMELSDSGGLVVRIGSYEPSDLDNAFLVIAATDNAVLNERIAVNAHERGILVTVADNPERGDCSFPALLQRGDLEIAVSTSGRCPTFAADIRDRIAEQIGHEYASVLDQLAGEREKLLTNGSPSTYNANVLRTLTRRLLAELTESKEFLP